MNEKQGEHLDQRIRQALSNLPDTPPPGSSFDSAQLWEQLRPELAAPPVARKRVAGWWWAAASVVGLLVGVWYGQSAPKQTTTIAQSVSLPPRSAKRGPVSSPIKEAEQTVHPSARKKSNLQMAIAVRFVNKAETVSIQQIEHPTTQEPISLTPITEVPKPAVATTPKKRFRVVHENELAAEDDAHRVRYANDGRTERFVRIGSGNPSQTTADEDLPALLLPLNRKTTQ